MRTLSVALILFAFIAIANVTTAHAGTVVDSYIYIDNRIDATVEVEVSIERMANGTYRYVYRITVFASNHTFIGWQYTPAEAGRPSISTEQEQIHGYLDPNGNGIGRWADPGDRIRVENQLE